MARDIYFRSLIQKLYGVYGRMENSRSEKSEYFVYSTIVSEKIIVYRVILISFLIFREIIGWKYLNTFRVKELYKLFFQYWLHYYHPK